jgi:hypothetical protein
MEMKQQGKSATASANWERPEPIHRETPDVTVTSYRTVLLLNPESEAGEQWIRDNVHAESWQWFGGSLALEPRYMDDVACGIRDAGLSIETE